MSTQSIVRALSGGLSLSLVLAGLPATVNAAPARKKPAAAEEAAPIEEAPAEEAPAEEAPAEAGDPTDPALTDGAVEDDEGPGVPTEGLVLDPAAADRANAEAAYRQGSDLYELGKYADAIEQFQRAWELSKESQLLYNLGQAHWKWFDADPEIDHLRQAALFFRNYDKRMRLTEDYEPVEIDNILKAIDAQIEVEERKIADANRPVLVQPGGPTEAELAWQQRRRTTKALNISGTTIIVLGGVTLAAGAAALVSRLGHKFVLDSATPSDGGINLATAEEDARRRDGFLVSGQVAFGTLIAAAAILPVGITLRVLGGVRNKKDRSDARSRDEERERNAKKAKVSLQPVLGGLRVRF